LEICNDVGFDFIEIRLDMLKDYLRTHSERELKHFFANHRIQPHAINALYTYKELFSGDDTAARREALMEDFLLGCKIAQQIGSHAFIVVPAHERGSAHPVCGHTGNTQERLRPASCANYSDIAADYDVNLCFELVGTQKVQRSHGTVRGGDRKRDRQDERGLCV
jgi:2-keto-myo-inositol isomerase